MDIQAEKINIIKQFQQINDIDLIRVMDWYEDKQTGLPFYHFAFRYWRNRN